MKRIFRYQLPSRTFEFSYYFFSSRRRHTRFDCDWSSDVCSSDLGGQAEYVRVPFADVGPFKVDSGIDDEMVLFLSDILPTGYMAAENCSISPGDIVAVWGAGPVGQFAIKSAFLLGAERVIAIDRIPARVR